MMVFVLVLVRLLSVFFEAGTHSLPGTIVAYNQRERCKELYGLAASVIEGTNSVARS